MDCSTPGLPVLHYLLELAQTHVLWVSDAIQPSHSLPPPSPPALDLSQHWGLFQWAGSRIRWPKWWGNPGHFSSLMSERVAWCLVGRAAAASGHGWKLNAGGWRCCAVGHSVHSQQQLHHTQGCREQRWQEEVLSPQSSGLKLPVGFLPSLWMSVRQAVKQKTRAKREVRSPMQWLTGSMNSWRDPGVARLGDGMGGSGLYLVCCGIGSDHGDNRVFARACH